MKKFLLSGAALIALLGGSASAADLAVKARPLPPAPVWSWSGFYVGINGGGSLGSTSHTFSNATIAPDAVPAIVQFNETFKRSLPGGVFGGQVGYNWQFSPLWVVGAEADWQWMNEKDDACLFGCGPNFFFAVAPGVGTTLLDSQKIKSLVTARARLGVTNAGWLWYVTGGAAWAKIDETMTLTGTIIPATPGFTSTAAATFSNTKSGWTIGGGVETALFGSNWSAKLEYLYADFGTITNSFATPTGFTIFGSSVTTSTYTLKDHIIRVGINYRFGYGGGIMAAY
jgi:outer membrane immunogenic protein